MIEEVNEKDICECVNVIRVSFATVADEFGFTAEMHLNSQHSQLLKKD